MAMRVTALGHAGLKVESAQTKLFIDPWLSPEGAFYASWFQYPSNEHLMQWPDIFCPTAVIISHEHLDHADGWYLSKLSPTVPVIIPHYPSPILQQKIQSAGALQIIEVQPWEVVDLGAECTVFFVSEESPQNHDSAIVIRADNQTLLNMNDARLSPAQLEGIRSMVGGNIDLLALQGAGASWHPICYEYPVELSRQISARKRLAKFDYAARVIRMVEPVATLPFAGPACFLDQELFKHNSEMEGGIFPDPQHTASWLTSQGLENNIVLLPGDAWDLTAKTKDFDPMWEGIQPFNLGSRWDYLHSYAAMRQPQIHQVLNRFPDPQESMWHRFREYFQNLLELSAYFNRKIGMRVGFDISGPGGGTWAVDFQPGNEGVFDRIEDCGYIYRFESRWLPPLLNREIQWEDFLLSLRFRAWRNPDKYNEHLLGLLKFANSEALEVVENYENAMSSDERITITAEGRTYRVQRYCPHAGNDLMANGRILDGRVLMCLAHQYEFSLDTGQCLSGMCPPLWVEPC